MTHSTKKMALPIIQSGMVLAGRYRILSKIGKGGMGYVFAGQEESLGITRMVAIKVLPPQLMLDESLMARFREEIKIASGLDHPHIVPIYSLGEHQGVYFYVMKLLDGMTSHQRMRKEGPFTEDEIRRFLAPIARALDYAHGKGVIHRDIKSNNIHISNDGFPTLMDFGIARSGKSTELTSPGQVVGTAECMSPEQWYGDAEPRSDIYSFGIVLFELVTGQLPFRAQHTFELMKLHQEVPPPSPRSLVPALSVDLEAIILKCLEKDPDYRFSTAGDLATALEKPFTPSQAVESFEEPDAMTRQQTAAHAAKTLALEAPSVELTTADHNLLEICDQADERYAAGELEAAIKLIGKAGKIDADHPQVTGRTEKFARMKELVETIASRADAALAKGKPRLAIEDYMNVLRVLPMPKVHAKLTRAKKQLAEAEKKFQRARNLRQMRKYDKALDLAMQAKRLNQELDNTAFLAPPPSKKKASRSRPRKPRAPIFTKGRVFVVFLIALIVGSLWAVRPALKYLADSAFGKSTPQALFLSPHSALHLYLVLDRLPGDFGASERIVKINARAKDYYWERAQRAIQSNDYEAAVTNLRKAVQFDDGDTKLRDWLELYEAKLKVKDSMN